MSLRNYVAVPKIYIYIYIYLLTVYIIARCVRLRLLWLLVFPLVHQIVDIYSTSLRLGDNGRSFPYDGCVDHGTVKSPRALASLRSLFIGDDDAHSPLNLLLAGRKQALHRLDLRGVDALLAVEAHGLAATALLLQARQPFLTLVRGTNEVDGARQRERAGRCRDGRTRVQKLGERGRARQRHI